MYSPYDRTRDGSSRTGMMPRMGGMHQQRPGSPDVFKRGVKRMVKKNRQPRTEDEMQGRIAQRMGNRRPNMSEDQINQIASQRASRRAAGKNALTPRQKAMYDDRQAGGTTPPPTGPPTPGGWQKPTSKEPSGQVRAQQTRPGPGHPMYPVIGPNRDDIQRMFSTMRDGGTIKNPNENPASTFMDEMERKKWLMLQGGREEGESPGGRPYNVPGGPNSEYPGAGPGPGDPWGGFGDGLPGSGPVMADPRASIDVDDYPGPVAQTPPIYVPPNDPRARADYPTELPPVEPLPYPGVKPPQVAYTPGIGGGPGQEPWGQSDEAAKRALSFAPNQSALMAALASGAFG